LIDLKQAIKDFGVINPKDISQNEADIPDNIRNSVFLYNKAIESLRTGSEDIAIIELKKAVSMNPHFYEAMNLLGVCYGYIKDNVRAAEMFDRVIKAEQNSVKALRYLSIINNGDDDEGSAKPRTRKRDTAPVRKRKGKPRHKTWRQAGKVIYLVKVCRVFCSRYLADRPDPEHFSQAGKN
jgi:hypothetical protein